MKDHMMAVQGKLILADERNNGLSLFGVGGSVRW